MIYLKTEWQHTHSDEPHLIYQEVDDKSWETRKIELFNNGSLCGYASRTKEVGSSIISDQPIPSINEINASSEFHAKLITQDEFEQTWKWAVTSSDSQS